MFRSFRSQVCFNVKQLMKPMIDDNKKFKLTPKTILADISYKQAKDSTGFDEKTMEPECISELKEKSRLRGHTSPKSERLR